MSHKRFLTAGLATLLVVGLLIMGGTSIYRSGQSQGYMMGRLSAGDDGAMAPYAPYYTGYPGRHFSAIPFLCSAGLFVLLLAGASLVLVGGAVRGKGRTGPRCGKR
ncbi:MAG: hypothetical protein B6I35_13770 [Anaerolineaceae bacterium 4572_32.2]|nr:MAG: hypothetical protein B6I35_13770 [Anaerolineaceae bacterium 4572_32.2]